MITTERTIEHFEKRCGGKGTIHIERLLPANDLKEQAKMFARITVDVGASIGFHTHTEDRESYFILQGKALYHDNGTCVELEAGACTMTSDGKGHAIENIGDEPLVFMALILNE